MYKFKQPYQSASNHPLFTIAPIPAQHIVPSVTTSAACGHIRSRLQTGNPAAGAALPGGCCAAPQVHAAPP